MKKIKIKADTDKSCGNCRFYTPVTEEGKSMEETYGECYAMPPTPIISEDGVGVLRPIVEVDDKPCAFHGVIVQ